MDYPEGFERWNRAYRGAFKKGMKARQDGLGLGACPYQDRRKPDGRLSWSRAFISAWRDGWEWAGRAMPQKHLNKENSHVEH